jgi:hypothetical protein
MSISEKMVSVSREWEEPRWATDVSSEDSLDEILARKSALTFLCKVNADYKEIERYLAAFPEALLFGSDESALESIVTSQMEACTCFGSTCKQNRRLILRALNRGFEFYRGLRLVNLVEDDLVNSMEKKLSEAYCTQLRDLERDLRTLKLQEMELEERIFIASQEMAELRLEIEEGSKGRQNQFHSQLLKLQCRRVKTHAFEERASVENELAAATLAISSLEEYRTLLQTEMATALRLQHALLKKSFSGCKRHICNASRYEV